MAAVSNADLRPRLVVTSQGQMRGVALRIASDDVVVGREMSADLRLDDPTVSRAHARLCRDGGQVIVQDLGSTGGTRVNGIPVLRPRLLQHGDTVSFAAVDTRFELDGAEHNRPERTVAGDAGVRRFDVERQYAERLSNVAGDQYNQYIHQVQEDRTAFLQELATLKTKAKRLVVFGFVLAITGFSIYASVVFRFIKSVDDAVSTQSTEPPTVRLLGPEVGGVPLAVIGFACAGLGMVLAIVGIVCHVIAALKKRRFNQQISSPWHLAAPPPVI